MGTSADKLLTDVLSSWGVDRFSVRRRLRGSGSSNWVVDLAGGPHVLRQIPDHESYVEYQLSVVAHLARSDFPYEVPRLVIPISRGAPYVAAEGSFWILYPFIEGSHHSSSPDTRRSRDVGRLVAHYARVMEDFDVGRDPALRLELFDRARTSAGLEAAARSLASRSDLPGLRSALLSRIDLLLARYAEIPDEDVARVRELPHVAIYYDWTSGNHLVDAQGDVRGLIDFDSVIEAPRIVDVQNALANVLVSGAAPDEELVRAFGEGYSGVLSLSREEVELVRPVALDRLAGLIPPRVEATLREPLPRRELLAIRLIELFCWLAEDRDPPWLHFLK